MPVIRYFLKYIWIDSHLSEGVTLLWYIYYTYYKKSFRGALSVESMKPARPTPLFWRTPSLKQAPSAKVSGNRTGAGLLRTY